MRLKVGWLVGALLVVVWLYWMTLRPTPAVATDLAPLTTSAARQGISVFWLIDIAGNIVVFMPLGTFLLLALDSVNGWRRLAWATCGGLMLSATIEGLQMAIPGRVTAWDDLGLNTLGAALGAAVAWGTSILFQKNCSKGTIR